MMLKKVLKISGSILLALLTVRLISIFLFPWYWVASESMEPTMPYDSHFFVNRYHYEFVQPKRGDVAVFLPYEKFPHEEWVHRIIAVPGDVVTVREGNVTVNGEEPINPYINGAEDLEVTVPEGKLFQKGDNSETQYGLVEQDLLIGKVIFSY